MHIHAAQPLLAWGCLDDCPTRVTLRDFLDTVPAQELRAGLRAARGHGRDDYPVERLWRVVLVTIALRPTAFNACLAELHRNPALCRLLDSTGADQLPHGGKVSRFLDVLGTEPHLAALRGVFDHLAQRLGLAVPDLGQHPAGDATALSARPKTDPKAVATETAQGLPQPTGGRNESKEEEGRVTKVVAWFGDKRHLLVAVRHAVALAYDSTDTQPGDKERGEARGAQAQAKLLAGRLQTLAYDKAADDEQVHDLLHRHGIQPVMQNRTWWPKEGAQEQVLPGNRQPLKLVDAESGTVHCYDTVSNPPVRHRMATIGQEHARACVKQRCPAWHAGWDCPSDEKCNGTVSAGLAARIPCALDLRRFPPIPRATKECERRYKGRTAVERVHARLKIFWGAADGNVTGARRFHGFVGAVRVVPVVFATLLAQAPRWEGTLGPTRLGSIAKTLRAPQLAEAS